LPRIPTFDVAKGAGILLVVYGHCLRGLCASGIATSDVWKTVDTILYLFHMPSFFVVGGMLCPLDKLATRREAWRRFWSLMFPYLVWTTIQGTFEILFSSLKNSPAGVDDVLRGFLHPRGQFWFLPAFLFATGFTLLCSRLPAWKIWILLPATLLALVPGLGRAGVYTAGFCFGAILARDGIVPLTRWKWILASVGMFCVGCIWILQHPVASVYKLGFSDGVLLMWIGVVGSAAFIGLCGLVRGRISDLLAFLGRHSMPIFLAHILFMSGARIVMSRLLGLGSLPVHVVVGVGIGVVGPLLLYWGARRARLSILLGG